MGFWSDLKDWFLGLLDQIQAWLAPAAKAIAINGGMALVAAAEKAVAAVAADPTILSDSDKRSAALDMILEDLKTQGIAIGLNAINIAIEAAVAAMKARQAEEAALSNQPGV